jgi:hypothetical protein
MSTNRLCSNDFTPRSVDVTGSSGWIREDPYVYLFDSTDQVIIGADVPIGTEKTRFVGYIRIDEPGQIAGIELDDGHHFPVSSAGEARIRYNGTTNQLEVSLSGAAYTPVGATGGTVYGVSGLQVIDLDTFQRIGNFRFNASDWPATATFTFEAIVDVQGAASVECQLYNLTHAAAVAGSLLTTAVTSPTYLSAAVVLPTGDHDYEVQLRVTATGATIVGACGMADIKIT